MNFLLRSSGIIALLQIAICAVWILSSLGQASLADVQNIDIGMSDDDLGINDIDFSSFDMQELKEGVSRHLQVGLMSSLVRTLQATQCRYISNKWDTVNCILRNLNVDVAMALDDITINNAKCMIPYKDSPGFLCVTLFFLFTNARLTCDTLALKGDISVDGNMGNRSVLWEDTRCRKPPSSVCKKEICGFRPKTFPDGQVQNESDGTLGCPGNYYVDGQDTLEREFVIRAALSKLHLSCTISPLKVVHTVAWDTGNINKTEQALTRPDGRLNLVADLDINFAFLLTSLSEFSVDPPRIAYDVARTEVTGGSPLTISALTFTFFNLGDVTLKVFGFDFSLSNLTQEVNDQINGDMKSVAQDPVQDILVQAIGSAAVMAKDLVGTVYDTYYDDLQLHLPSTVNVNVTNATQVEANFPENNANFNLVDLGDNFVVNLVGLFPDDSDYVAGENATSNAIIDAGYTLLTNSSVVIGEGVDPILGVVDSLLGTELAKPDAGEIRSLDLMLVLKQFLGDEYFAPDGTFSYNLNISIQTDKPDAIFLKLQSNKAIAKFVPRSDAPQEAIPQWLLRTRLIGGQTVLVPRIEGFDIDLDLNLDFEVDLPDVSRFIPSSSNLTADILGILESVRPIHIDGEYSIGADWLDFLVTTAGVVAIQEEKVSALELGPLIGNLMDCLLSVFYIPVSLTALELGSQGGFIELKDVATDGTDGILTLVTSAVNMIAPLYIGAVPWIVGDVVQSAIIGMNLTNITTCPISPPPVESDDLFPFVGDLMDQIKGFLTEDGVTGILSGILPASSNTDRPGLVTAMKAPLTVLQLDDIPTTGGLDSSIVLGIGPLDLFGLNPPNFTDFDLLNVTEGPNFPYALFNEIGIGIESNPFGVVLDISLDVIPTREVVDDDDTLSSNPWTNFFSTFQNAQSSRTLFGTPTPSAAQANKLRLEASFVNLYVMLDLLIKMTNYSVVSHKLGEVLNLNCWLADMLPYSGVKDLALVIDSANISFSCIQCDNDILKALEAKFQEPGTNELFFAFANNLIHNITFSIKDLFADDDKWNSVFDTFKLACYNSRNGTTAVTQYAPVAEDLTLVLAFVGSVGGLLIILLFINKVFYKDPYTIAGLRLKLEMENAEEEEDYELEKKKKKIELLESIPLFKHPCIPGFIRLLVPILFIINTVMFVLGHLGQAISVTILAGVLGVPIELPEFQTISVLQSVQKLLESGGYLLAVLILVVSVVWPYLKILSMSIAWFSPSVMLGVYKRGSLIRRLDQLGKWSFIELILLLMLLVAFQIQVENPEEFLPAGLYHIQLIVETKTSMYTFAVALLISLGTNNLISWYQTHVMAEIVSVYRPVGGKDEIKYSLRTFEFDRKNGRKRLPLVVFCFISFLSIAVIGTLVIASLQTVLDIEIFGIAALAFRAQNKPTLTPYEVISFVTGVFAGDVTAGVVFLAIFFILIVLALPIVQLIILNLMIYVPMTLSGASKIYELNTLLSSWIANEVFLFGVAVTVLELGQISGNLVKAECAFLQPIMETWLVPSGLVSQVDVEAHCLTMVGHMEFGMYLLAGAMFIINVVYYFVSLSFLRMLLERLNVHKMPHPPKCRSCCCCCRLLCAKNQIKNAKKMHSSKDDTFDEPDDSDIEYDDHESFPQLDENPQSIDDVQSTVFDAEIANTSSTKTPNEDHIAKI